jgi:hypothetical protein
MNGYRGTAHENDADWHAKLRSPRSACGRMLYGYLAQAAPQILNHEPETLLTEDSVLRV